MSNFAEMEYVFNDTGKDNGIAAYRPMDEQDLLFMVACLILRRMHAEVIISPSMKSVADVLVELPFAEIKNGKLILHPEKIRTEEKLTVDASAFPGAVFGLSVLFAATGTEADITGLESLSTGNELEQITCLQRMLYRLNINTDYCGGSKFKVYNHKVMKAGPGLKPVAENFGALLLIPAVIKTGELRMEMEEDVLKGKMEIIAAGGIVVGMFNVEC